ncbi:threonine dehydrogenase-like Zn-dependent dehydrogenase [Arthrobacter sp. UYEF36]
MESELRNSKRKRAPALRATIMHAPGDVRVEERDNPTIQQPTDAIIKLVAACVCGSDLWPYRGADSFNGPVPMGHEVLQRP